MKFHKPWIEINKKLTLDARTTTFSFRNECYFCVNVAYFLQSTSRSVIYSVCKIWWFFFPFSRCFFTLDTAVLSEFFCSAYVQVPLPSSLCNTVIVNIVKQESSCIIFSHCLFPAIYVIHNLRTTDSSLWHLLAIPLRHLNYLITSFWYSDILRCIW